MFFFLLNGGREICRSYQPWTCIYLNGLCLSDESLRPQSFSTKYDMKRICYIQLSNQFVVKSTVADWITMSTWRTNSPQDSGPSLEIFVKSSGSIHLRKSFAGIEYQGDGIPWFIQAYPCLGSQIPYISVGFPLLDPLFHNQPGTHTIKKPSIWRPDAAWSVRNPRIRQWCGWRCKRASGGSWWSREVVSFWRPQTPSTCNTFLYRNI